jgi:UDP-N-acetylmuramyl pentapeptide phosphotransferase/UDP-N-acetylglucosamine-1-phosphate transferase
VYAVVDIFSLLTAAAGWYYLFYSRAAQKLGAVEEGRINARRVQLRRAGGGVMLLLGVLFFAGFQEGLANATFLGIWCGVLVLLGAIVVLALYDVRLTLKLHKHRQNPRL